MLDGFALCADDQEYQRTYLDKIKIKQGEFDDKPVHIDKLFEDEDQFLEDASQNFGESTNFEGFLDPERIININKKSDRIRKKN